MRALALIGVLVAGCDDARDANVGTPAGSGTPATPADAACPMFGSTPKTEVVCRCGRPAASIPGQRVVGTAQYTSDSHLCRAAVHAGVISADGGWLRYRASIYCYAFVGSTSHGIDSRSQSTGDLGFYFPDAAEPNTCSQKLRDRVLPFDPDRKSADKPCPPTFAIDAKPAPLTCSCGAPIAATPVTGSNPYSLDTAPCIAAVHAGAIPPAGGDISLDIFDGCAPLLASVAHGVSSHAANAGGRVYWIHASAERPPPCPQP